MTGYELYCRLKRMPRIKLENTQVCIDLLKGFNENILINDIIVTNDKIILQTK